MRIPRLISLLVLPLALAACGDATGSEHPFSAAWVRMEETGPIAAESREYLHFGADGRFTREIGGGGFTRDLSRFYREEGEYRVRGDRLELSITLVTEWNVAEGGPPRVTTLAGEWYDAGTVHVVGNLMVRRYFSEPPDARAEIRATYRRLSAQPRPEPA